MLTLHLNAADLGRTVVRPTASILLELASAAQRVFLPTVPEHLAGWQARTRAALRPAMRPLTDLCRLPHWLPDFLTPAQHEADVLAAVNAVCATPLAALHRELGPRVDAGDFPPRVAALAAGDLTARKRLRAAMVAFHTVAVAPYWPAIVAAVHADRAIRGHAVLDVGIDQVLRDLSPHLHWASCGATYRLSYECASGVDLDVVPQGRGVTLVPSYFLAETCLLDDPHGPLVLAYPIRPTPRQLTTGKPLADLLGRTRAAVLAAIVGGPSTSQVARTLGISVASASEHTATLRSAGLVTTHRSGPSVRHVCTPLGEELLGAARPCDGQPAEAVIRR